MATIKEQELADYNNYYQLGLQGKRCPQMIIADAFVDAAQRYGAEVVGPVPLPTAIHKYSVNRSTFVHKSSGDQYEMRVHKRLVDIINPNQKIIESLADLNLPAGVDVEIKA